MHKITEQQLFDYMFCPAKYDIKYNMKIAIEEPRTLNSLVKIVEKYFYINLMNGKLLSTDQLKRKWDSICEANLDFIDKNKVLKGISYILQFHRWAIDKKLPLVDTEIKYNIIVDNVELEGTTNPLIAKNNNYYFLDVQFKSKIPDKTIIDSKIKYTIDTYAFESIYQKEPLGVEILKITDYTIIKTTRSSMDYNKLESTIKGISNGILHGAYYPRENILCTECNAKNYCRYWSK